MFRGLKHVVFFVCITNMLLLFIERVETCHVLCITNVIIIYWIIQDSTSPCCV
jgi:hypothetical protein